MIIENNTLDRWKSYKQYGDIKEICRVKNVDRNQVYNAFKNGESTEEVFEAINSFYAERHQRVTESKNKLA